MVTSTMNRGKETTSRALGHRLYRVKHLTNWRSPLPSAPKARRASRNAKGPWSRAAAHRESRAVTLTAAAAELAQSREQRGGASDEQGDIYCPKSRRNFSPTLTSLKGSSRKRAQRGDRPLRKFGGEASSTQAAAVELARGRPKASARAPACFVQTWHDAAGATLGGRRTKSGQAISFGRRIRAGRRHRNSSLPLAASCWQTHR